MMFHVKHWHGAASYPIIPYIDFPQSLNAHRFLNEVSPEK